MKYAQFQLHAIPKLEHLSLAFINLKLKILAIESLNQLFLDLEQLVSVHVVIISEGMTTHRAIGLGRWMSEGMTTQTAIGLGRKMCLLLNESQAL